MKKFLGFALSMTLAGGALTPAAAAPVTYCSPSSLQVCAAFDASTMLDGSGKWHLVLRVWNAFDYSAANGVSHAMTFAGIGSSWAGTSTLTSATFNGSAISWGQTKNIANNVVGAALDFGASSNNGINQGLVGCTQPMPPGQYQTCLPGGPMLVLDFVTSTQFNLNGAVYGWHSQAINGTTCSLWASGTGAWVSQTGANIATTPGGDCTATVTPEPVTVVLLGTGMAGIALMRRRRKQAEGLPAV